MPVRKQKDAATAKRRKANPRRGSSFDDFLKQGNIYEEVVAQAKKEIAAFKPSLALKKRKRRDQPH